MKLQDNINDNSKMGGAEGLSSNLTFRASSFKPETDFRSLETREWITTEQAADYLGLTVGALRNMTSNGQVPYYKLGKRNRYLVADLRELLLANKRGV